MTKLDEKRANQNEELKSRIDRHIEYLESIKESIKLGDNVYDEMYKLSCGVDKTTRLSLPIRY